MKKVGNMKLYSFEELLEEDYGKVGTPERDAFERRVDEAVRLSLGHPSSHATRQQALEQVAMLKATKEAMEGERKLTRLTD